MPIYNKLTLGESSKSVLKRLVVDGGKHNLGIHGILVHRPYAHPECNHHLQGRHYMQGLFFDWKS